jgi:dimethylargininase
MTLNSETSTFHQAIVRPPGVAFASALTSIDRGMPDLSAAIEQHDAYVRAVERCGVSIRILEPDEHPDSTFVEDVAICTPECAIVTRPGVESRQEEVESIRAVLADYFDETHEIAAPGTLDGGDVLEVNGHFLIGLSARTNESGANQLIRLLNNYGMTGEKVSFPAFLHLKSGVCLLDEDTVLLANQFSDLEQFERFKRIVTKEEDGYAANSIRVNGTIFTPAGFPRVSAGLCDAGFDVIELEMWEFQKVDGGLSCLSLRF